MREDFANTSTTINFNTKFIKVTNGDINKLNWFLENKIKQIRRNVKEIKDKKLNLMLKLLNLCKDFKPFLIDEILLDNEKTKNILGEKLLNKFKNKTIPELSFLLVEEINKIKKEHNKDKTKRNRKIDFPKEMRFIFFKNR